MKKNKKKFTNKTDTVPKVSVKDCFTILNDNESGPKSSKATVRLPIASASKIMVFRVAFMTEGVYGKGYVGCKGG
jgi:hypothetical protein